MSGSGQSTAPSRAIDGFRRQSAGRCTVLVANEWEAAIGLLGLLEPGGLERALAERSGPVGRGGTAIVALPGCDARLHLRPFHHGGWLGGVRGQALLGPGRPIGELRVTAALAAAGAPVPTPILAVAERRGALWRAAVGTLFEEDSANAGAFLAAAPSRARLLRAAGAAGLAVRRFHDAGGRHRDLHIGNLLVREREAETEIIVIDLDRASIASRVGARRRIRELMRLHRSLVKRGYVQTVGPRGYARFWSAYTGGDRRLRTELLSHVGRERLRIAVHTIGYRARS